MSLRDFTRRERLLGQMILLVVLKGVDCAAEIASVLAVSRMYTCCLWFDYGTKVCDYSYSAQQSSSSSIAARLKCW